MNRQLKIKMFKDALQDKNYNAENITKEVFDGAVNVAYSLDLISEFEKKQVTKAVCSKITMAEYLKMVCRECQMQVFRLDISDLLKTYSYSVVYSEKDKKYLAACPQMPTLSFLHKNKIKAFEGIVKLVEDSVQDSYKEEG